MIFFLQTNTFQGLVITDFTTSYAVFTYKCGDLGFSGDATIGFTAGDVLFANHRTSGYLAKRIACVNSPDSQWVNLVYKLTADGLISFPSGILTIECVHIHVPKGVRIHECHK